MDQEKERKQIVFIKGPVKWPVIVAAVVLGDVIAVFGGF